MRTSVTNDWYHSGLNQSAFPFFYVINTPHTYNNNNVDTLCDNATPKLPNRCYPPIQALA